MVRTNGSKSHDFGCRGDCYEFVIAARGVRSSEIESSRQTTGSAETTNPNAWSRAKANEKSRRNARPRRLRAVVGRDNDSAVGCESADMSAEPATIDEQVS